MKYIVIGGVAGGASFSCRLRRLDENAKITIYEKTNFVSYANCGLPYYISGIISKEESLTLQTPLSLKERFNLDVKVNHEVIKINQDKKEVVVKNLITKEEFTDNYDKLIIATGANAIKITNDSKGIFTLKTVEDSIRIKKYIIDNNIKEAVVIGGGFIGLEILENLKELGLDVTLIEGGKHILPNIDSEMATFLHKELRKNNVNLLLGKKVTKITNEDGLINIYLDDKVYQTNLLIEAIGVKPASDLAISSGLELDFKNAIKINGDFKTSKEDIYAIGDVTLINSDINNELYYLPLAGNANKEGRLLADKLVMGDNTSIKACGTSILKLFSVNVASTGFSEEILKRKNINYQKIYLSPANHATYYPNATSLIMKVLLADDYSILGAQIIGKDGVDKRIDLLAMAIKFDIKAYELKKLELAYAPPFGSAKDPINMIGFMTENIKNGLIKQFYAEDVKEIVKDNNALLIDVRTKQEYEYNHIETSINIPVDELRKNLAKIPFNKKLYLICHSAIRSYVAARILIQKGYDVSHLAGGMIIYNAYLKSVKEGE